ncbi:sugar transferase [Plastoroseomonas hellenica]|uniref:sugar transferase n=1 Tax=Plastoroseomonas hellenica TaxID=2687306 RepID=UPI001BA68146|nr:sugar transferase [Plastoroseomonas hellenica]MBR0646739.1 sugar transferase [Plastoroseomonas hellenica]
MTPPISNTFFHGPADPGPAAVESPRTRHDLTDAGKRAFDMTAALVLCLLLLPVLLFLIIAVRCSGSPVFYSHQRVGRHGKPFGCLKLRTMRPDGDRMLEALLQSDPVARQEWLATRKLRNDPRITRLGRFLRTTSLDELPQLFNVLRGDMSLVGPRPVVAAELTQYYGPDGAAAYEAVRPGITGLWQVSGRSDTGYAERVALDMTYVRDRSLLLDLKILWRTVGAVLCRDGAC